MSESASASGLSRRTFVVGASAIAGSGVVGAGLARASAAVADEGVMAATVVDILAPETIVVVPYGRETRVRVNVVSGATIVRDGRSGAALGDFAVGDIVAIEPADSPGDIHKTVALALEQRKVTARAVTPCVMGVRAA